MKVQIIKTHKTWEDIFPLNDIVELKGNSIISNVNKEKYDARDLCKSFSNKTSFFDILKKV